MTTLSQAARMVRLEGLFSALFTLFFDLVSPALLFEGQLIPVLPVSMFTYVEWVYTGCGIWTSVICAVFSLICPIFQPYITCIVIVRSIKSSLSHVLVAVYMGSG